MSHCSTLRRHVVHAVPAEEQLMVTASGPSSSTSSNLAYAPQHNYSATLEWPGGARLQRRGDRLSSFRPSSNNAPCNSPGGTNNCSPGGANTMTLPHYHHHHHLVHHEFSPNELPPPPPPVSVHQMAIMENSEIDPTAISPDKIESTV